MGKKPVANPRQKKQDPRERMLTKLAEKKGEKIICLTMIVKNESKNMVRLFESLKSVIDLISILDTGSTDNTAEVISKWGADNKVPTTVHSDPFRDFGYCRTLSLNLAKKTYPQADYFLLSDADFVWSFSSENEFDKVLLIDHKYLVKQENNCLDYWNIRMLHSKVDWECVGVTHEFWRECGKQEMYSGVIRTGKISSIRIDDREDGGCKADKFERDERLLRGGLADPNTPRDLLSRYKFYLGQTLKDMGRYEESIPWYQARVDDGGWAEEVYFSRYQIGINWENIGGTSNRCIGMIRTRENKKEELSEEEKVFIAKYNPTGRSLEELAKYAETCFSKALTAYLGAWNFRKVRAEALYRFVCLHRNLGHYNDAAEYAAMGKKIIYPQTDNLFIERACYDYLFDYELAICGTHLATLKATGKESVKKLLQRTDLPERITKSVEDISRFYI